MLPARRCVFCALLIVVILLTMAGLILGGQRQEADRRRYLSVRVRDLPVDTEPWGALFGAIGPTSPAFLPLSATGWQKGRREFSMG